MLEPHTSNFRVITTNVLGVRIFRKFTVITNSIIMTELSWKFPFFFFKFFKYTLPFKLYSHSFPSTQHTQDFTFKFNDSLHQSLYGPRQANLVLIAYASSEGSGQPAHPGSLARTFAARSYKQWVKRNRQTEGQIPSPSEWLGMRS